MNACRPTSSGKGLKQATVAPGKEHTAARTAAARKRSGPCLAHPAHLNTRFVSLVTVAGRCGAFKEGSGVSTCKCWDCGAGGDRGKAGKANIKRACRCFDVQAHSCLRQQSMRCCHRAGGTACPTAPRVNQLESLWLTDDCMLLLYTMLLTM